MVHPRETQQGQANTLNLETTTASSSPPVGPGHVDMNLPSWIHLGDAAHEDGGKSFSRILYVNPVCFLTTVERKGRANVSTASTRSSGIASLDSHNSTGIAGDNKQDQDEEEDVGHSSSNSSSDRKNVMVVSWLTAINNKGGFIMSINKRRHTASILTSPHPRRRMGIEEKSEDVKVKGDEGLSGNIKDNGKNPIFVLCVPVKGMEELVLNCGKTSGRWGRSKFPRDYHHNHHDQGLKEDVLSTVKRDTGNSNSSSTNLKKRKKKYKFDHGIEGLEAIQFGGMDQRQPSLNTGLLPEADGDGDVSPSSFKLDDDGSQENCFAIRGTVAHLKCRVQNIITEGNDISHGSCRTIEDDHHIIHAQVIDGYVRSDYWDAEKKQFRPTRRLESSGNFPGRGQTLPPPPYMTFLGSQTFGYVACDLTL